MAESSTSRGPRFRITKEGSAFLSNYARTVNSYPQRREKETILAHLRAIPGNETFTLEKLTNWFARHRTPRIGAASTTEPTEPHAVLVDDETILFPKLSPTHLQQLRVLYRKRAYPSEGIITFWASRINADRTEVAAWILYQQEKAKEISVDASPEPPEMSGDNLSPASPDRPRPHLPTPSKSLSPSPHTRMLSLPPIAVKVEESQRCPSPVSSLTTPLWQPPPVPPHIHPTESRSALEGLPPRLQQTQEAKASLGIIPPSRRSGQPSSRHLDTSLAAAIRDSLRPDAILHEEPPRTASEFAEKFKGVETMINGFIKKCDTGQLARLGWDPNESLLLEVDR